MNIYYGFRNMVEIPLVAHVIIQIVHHETILQRHYYHHATLFVRCSTILWASVYAQ